jgi:hypothetical protein
MGRHAHSRQWHRRASFLGGDAENQGQGHRITTGEDKASDTADHVANLRAFNVTPHVTQNNGIKEPPERHRRTDHAPPTLWHAAIAPADDRMHLRLGQAAWHSAKQNIASSAALQPISCST